MSHPEPHRPNVIGCAFGFAWIGAGVGSIVGSVIGGQVRQSTSGISTIYSWMYPSIAIGCVLGTFAGVAYAFCMRRRIDRG